MTTPSVNIDVDLGPMPFGVPMTWTPDSREGQIAPEHQNNDNQNAKVRVYLDPGLYMLQAVYDGPEQVNIRHGKGYGAEVVANTVASLPAVSGGGGVPFFRPGRNRRHLTRRIHLPVHRGATQRASNRRPQSHTAATACCGLAAKAVV